jgi:hypothetical protein
MQHNYKTMETTNTVENLYRILIAMNNIKPIDRSNYFNHYYQELNYRIYCERQANNRKECIPFELFIESDYMKSTDGNIHWIDGKYNPV